MKNGEFKGMQGHAGSSAVYGLGLIGALVYFLQHANTFKEVIMGFLKAIVWPAFLVYRVFEFLRF